MATIPPHQTFQSSYAVQRQLPTDHRGYRNGYEHHDHVSFLFAIESARHHAGPVDILIRFVTLPQPANHLVASMERRLLAFETGAFGRNLFEKEVLQ